MATQGPLIDDGSQTISGFDARNSSITGTTLAGPNGSGQFLFVQLSTTVARTVNLTTAAGVRSVYGVLQNKPSTGIAADVGIFGITKLVSGSTAIDTGMLLESSTLATAIPFSSAAAIYPAARSLETATAVGQVFTAALFGFGSGSLG